MSSAAAPRSLRWSEPARPIHVLGIGTGLTAAAAAIFFWSRLAHAVIYALGIRLQ